MSLRTIPPIEAKRLMDEGATLIDIREAAEHARERIPGARHIPLSGLDEAGLAAHRGRMVIFHCRSGARTRGNDTRLAAAAGAECEALVVEGGLDAWRKAGLPVARDPDPPIGLQRQVRTGAAGPAVAGTALGLTVSAWFVAISLLVATGLLIAGITKF